MSIQLGAFAKSVPCWYCGVSNAMGDAMMSSRPKNARRLCLLVRVVDLMESETLPHSGQVIGRSPALVVSYQHFGQRLVGRPRRPGRSQNHDQRMVMIPATRSVIAMVFQSMILSIQDTV